MTGFTSPNHTQTPNDLFDVHMKDMGECELKVVLYAIRQTMGFHKASDEISITQFQKATGLSRQGVIKGIEAATKRGLIEEVGTGKRGVKVFGLVIILDQSEIQTSSSQQNGLVEASTSQKFRPTKESSKEKRKKVIAPEKGADESAPKSTTIEAIPSFSHSDEGTKSQEPPPPVSAPTPSPRSRNPMFDAVCEYVFGIADADELKILNESEGAGARIMTVVLWLEKKVDKYRKGSSKRYTTVGFISRAASVENVKQFAGDWKLTHPNADCPRDLETFVLRWREWASKRNGRKVMPINALSELPKTEPMTDEQRAANVTRIQEAKRKLEESA